jgi:hypothetical protein
VGLDPGGHPQQDLWHPGPAGHEVLEPVELVVAVDHDAPHAGVEGGRQLVGGLVVAVEDDPPGFGAARQGDVQLAARRDVDAHPLLGHQCRHRLAEERLAGVAGTVTEGGDRLPAALPEVQLVVDEQRRPVLHGEVAQVDPADGEAARAVDHGGEGQQVGRQRPAARRHAPYRVSRTPRRSPPRGGVRAGRPPVVGARGPATGAGYRRLHASPDAAATVSSP